MSTLKDIAARAGVSHTTVASALHGNGRVSHAQRRRIRHIAREMGYQPKTIARLMRTKRTGRLGIVVAQPDPVEAISRGGSFGSLIATLFKQCKERGIPQHIDFCETGAEGETFTPPEHVAGGFVDGAVVMGWIGPQFKTWLDESARKPWVHLTEPAPLCVLHDHHATVRLGAEHLRELGHRRVAFTCGHLAYEVHRTGLDAFKQMAQSCGFEVDWDHWIYTADRKLSTQTREAHMDDVLAWATRVLSATPRPTAVLFNSTAMARPVIEAARRLGIDVPGELSVVGYGSAPIATQSYPRLTTVERDVDRIVSRAIDLLQSRIEAPDQPDHTEAVPPYLVERDSAAPCLDRDRTA